MNLANFSTIFAILLTFSLTVKTDSTLSTDEVENIFLNNIPHLIFIDLIYNLFN